MPDRKQAMGTAKVGEKGQIVIPKEVRDMFEIKSGDTLVLMADTERGIAIMPPGFSRAMMDQLMSAFAPGADEADA